MQWEDAGGWCRVQPQTNHSRPPAPAKAMRLKADWFRRPPGRICIHKPRRRPRWTTRHPASNPKPADFGHLLQDSPPHQGRAVRYSRRHSNCTDQGALGVHCPTPGSLSPRSPGQPLQTVVHPRNHPDPRARPGGFCWTGAANASPHASHSGQPLRPGLALLGQFRRHDEGLVKGDGHAFGPGWIDLTLQV